MVARRRRHHARRACKLCCDNIIVNIRPVTVTASEVSDALNVWQSVVVFKMYKQSLIIYCTKKWGFKCLNCVNGAVIHIELKTKLILSISS